MSQHQMESNPPVAESNRDSNTRRAARHGRLLELDEDSETSTCALQERRSTSELIQQINGTNVVPTASPNPLNTSIKKFVTERTLA